jgi:hypothetical protein
VTRPGVSSKKAPKKREGRFRKEDSEMCIHVKINHDKYTSDKMLSMIHHPFSSKKRSAKQSHHESGSKAPDVLFDNVIEQQSKLCPDY